MKSILGEEGGIFSLFDYGSLQFATRWHTTDHNGAQSLASHSYNTTLFAVILAKKILKDEFTEISELALMRYTLHHDIAELVCGDQPSPYKRALKSMLPELEQAQAKIEANIYPMAHAYKRALLGTPLLQIAKLADYLDALHFITVKGQNNPQTNRIIEKLHGYIEEHIQKARTAFPNLAWQEYKRVMDELFHGYSAKELFEDIELYQKG